MNVVGRDWRIVCVTLVGMLFTIGCGSAPSRRASSGRGPMPGGVTALAVGEHYVCALVEGGSVFCGDFPASRGPGLSEWSSLAEVELTASGAISLAMDRDHLCTANSRRQVVCGDLSNYGASVHAVNALAGAQVVASADGWVCSSGSLGWAGIGCIGATGERCVLSAEAGVVSGDCAVGSGRVRCASSESEILGSVLSPRVVDVARGERAACFITRDAPGLSCGVWGGPVEEYGVPELFDVELLQEDIRASEHLFVGRRLACIQVSGVDLQCWALPQAETNGRMVEHGRDSVASGVIPVGDGDAVPGVLRAMAIHSPGNIVALGNGGLCAVVDRGIGCLPESQLLAVLPAPRLQ